jgi:hypothetical protein
LLSSFGGAVALRGSFGSELEPWRGGVDGGRAASGAHVPKRGREGLNVGFEPFNVGELHVGELNVGELNVGELNVGELNVGE